MALPKLVPIAAGALSLAALAGVLLYRAPSAQPPAFGAVRVPEGFSVEKVAGADLVAYPMLGTLDDRGRLFLCESSGRNLTNKEMSGDPEFRVRLLEDLNGDGRFDRSTVFADRLTLPAGAVWHNGSLYVAAPPDLLRFDDTDGDGVSDRREVIVTGWNLSSNAASLHGPFLGPDGWLYLTDGRHGYKIKTKEGPVLEGRASRIWRTRMDGTGLEWVSGGGFDNPVELVFTPAGETIGTMTYFTDPKNGERDALLHFVEGGVYSKWHPTVSEFKRTGGFMPVMTKFARIAPAGLLLYRGGAFGPAFQGNLFSAQFNPHRVQRHVLSRVDATFQTQDEDFLTSTDPDFHPTDVMEDADGSLLVVDTGGWFLHGCPVSRISKPEVRGGVYRVRRTGAPRTADPFGLALNLEKLAPAEVARYMEDSRPAVRDRAGNVLINAGDAAVPALRDLLASSKSAEVRAAAVFALGRIGARGAVREALNDPDFVVQVAAARMIGLARDGAATGRLMELARRAHPAARRQAATALGQIGDARAAAALIAASGDPEDRFVEHAIIDALIRLRTPGPATAALRHPSASIRKAALIVLDQMDGTPLDKTQVAPLLRDADAELRRTALWVFSHHPDWSGEVVQFLRSRLEASGGRETEALREALLAFSGTSEIQALMAELLDNPALDADRRLLILETMDRSPLKALPKAWVARIGKLVSNPDGRLASRAVALIRARGIADFDERLSGLAGNSSVPDEIRIAAQAVVLSRRPQLDAHMFGFLLGSLDAQRDAAVRLSAAQVFVRAELDRSQRLELARRLVSQQDALITPALLEKLRTPDDEAVRRELGPLLEQVEAGQRSRAARLRKLEVLLNAGGDVARGRNLFFGEKVACGSCHTIGVEGGHVGPDLTAIGAIRSGHDLLEAIVFPSVSFVPGHEVYVVETASEIYSGVIQERNAEVVVLVAGPQDVVRIPRDRIRSMRPSTVSLMPDGLDESLSMAEMTDLMAFLQAQKTR
ncbi:MAG: PVC-type heme-binding CxxCH protein [Bryobacteraceae bacterium]